MSILIVYQHLKYHIARDVCGWRVQSEQRTWIRPLPSAFPVTVYNGTSLYYVHPRDHMKCPD